MKAKNIVIIFFIFLYKNIIGQEIQNSDFESFQPDSLSPGQVYPKAIGWEEDDPSSNWIIKTNESHSGNFAIFLGRTYSEGLWSPHILSNGENIYYKGTDGWTHHRPSGSPISFKPEKITGYYKYKFVYPPTDSALVKIILTKFNPTNKVNDTIGYGEKKLGSTDNYIPFDVNISDLKPSVLPDSITISFIASSLEGHGNAFACGTRNSCSYLYIDDLSFFSTLNVIENQKKLKINVFPNPTYGIFNIKIKSGSKNIKISVLNITGQTIYTEPNRDSGDEVHTIDLTGKAPGIYVLKILADEETTNIKMVIQ